MRKREGGQIESRDGDFGLFQIRVSAILGIQHAFANSPRVPRKQFCSEFLNILPHQMRENAKNIYFCWCTMLNSCKFNNNNNNKRLIKINK